MFCADYISAYLYHAALKAFLLQNQNQNKDLTKFWNSQLIQTGDMNRFWNAHPFLAGTLAGVMGRKIINVCLSLCLSFSLSLTLSLCISLSLYLTLSYQKNLLELCIGQ